MLQTLLVNLKLHFREKAQLFWLFAFPIILATMFNGMFGNIAESYALHTVDVVVVNNDDWRASPGAQMLVDGISSDTGATGADGDHAKVDDDGDAMPKLITVTEAASMEAADRALLDAKAQGRLSVDGSGKLQLAISQATQTSATDVMASSSGLDISLTVLGNIVDLYNHNTAVVINAAQHNPSALLDDAFTGSIGSSSGFTKEVQLTNFKPSGTARYYYALLGMAAMMAMSFAVNAVSLAQANLSALGIRRSVAPLPKLQQLLAGFLSSWICSFLSLTVAMLYIRFGCQISLGGREWAGLGACLMASFATSAFGTLIGAIQGVSECQAGIVHGLGMHAVAVFRFVWLVRHGFKRSDSAAYAPVEHVESGATDYESVLRHSVLRQFPPVLCHGGRIGCDELGLSWYGDRSVEEATL